MLLWGVAVVTPLALQPTPRVGYWLHFTAALMAAGWLWEGPWLLAGATAWLATTLGLAAWGANRLAGRRPFCPAASTKDLGLIYAPVGGVWTFAFAWQRGLMGFDPTMTMLTGVHFCYVTLGAMQWAGWAGQYLPHTRWYRALTGLMWVSPALVAAGITHTHWSGHPTWGEGLAVLAQVVATSGLSLLWVGHRFKAGLPGGMVTLSALCSLVTMALALNYAWGRLLHAPHLDLSWMIPYHGLLNALGFVSLGLLGFRSISGRPDNLRQ